jgi:hypothetical protein
MTMESQDEMRLILVLGAVSKTPVPRRGNAGSNVRSLANCAFRLPGQNSSLPDGTQKHFNDAPSHIQYCANDQ